MKGLEMSKIAYKQRQLREISINLCSKERDG